MDKPKEGWTITHQDTSTYPYTWGTLSFQASSDAGKWTYNGGYVRDEESDWSAWIDNNPPVIQRKRVCGFNEHDWVDTGLAKTWCKRCDLSGRWVLGNVEIDQEQSK